MSGHPAARRHALPLLIAAGLASGCTPSTGSIEGKYYNAQTGQFTLELKGGKVLMPPGMEMMNANYTVRGDSIMLTDPRGGGAVTALVRQKDGSIDAGLLGTLKRK
jgi:hypothetical protein